MEQPLRSVLATRGLITFTVGETHYAAPDPNAEQDGPIVLAVYEIAGREVLGLDYWSLMDSIAPPAAFRLSGIGGR